MPWSAAAVEMFSQTPSKEKKRFEVQAVSFLLHPERPRLVLTTASVLGRSTLPADWHQDGRIWTAEVRKLYASLDVQVCRVNAANTTKDLGCSDDGVWTRAWPLLRVRHVDFYRSIASLLRELVTGSGSGLMEEETREHEVAAVSDLLVVLSVQQGRTNER